MTPFLKQVADHYVAAGDPGGNCFVFPNRRSALFFRKYLAEALKESGSAVPVIAPATIPINDFFYRICGGEATDKLRLLIELHGCYNALVPVPEPLDDFLFWGDVILSDFDDIDKYLVNARDLLRDVADFRAIQDDFSYLTKPQNEALTRFLGNFKDGGQEVKGRFLKIWNILFPLYESFRSALRAKGMSYEGMVYRDLAARLGEEPAADVLKEAFPGVKKFIFVGLNALNNCEKAVLKAMKKAGMAEFCWDFRSNEIRNPDNIASFFMKGNITEFPATFWTDPEGLPDTEFEIISVPSAAGQVKMTPEILSGCGGDLFRTALVLPDESLLMPLLNSLPREVEDVNITMGYPMMQSTVYSMMGSVAALQLNLRKKGDELYFYHKPVGDLFSCGLFMEMLSEAEREAVALAKKEARYYVPASGLAAGPLLRLVFREAGNISDYLREIIHYAGIRLKGNPSRVLELDFAKRYHTAVGILDDITDKVSTRTFLRILDAHLKGLSVPFNGEPLRGLQIMGPLETRALDFDNVVIFSSDDGIFPRHSVSASFIPPELRKGFGLPTYEYQDAVWAYYFYRLIQRASKVTMVWDSRTEGIKAGEESRYIKQLEYHFGKKLNRRVAAPGIGTGRDDSDIVKTPEDIAAIKGKNLSATAIKNYLRCPASFYYSFVKGLDDQEEVADSVDSRIFGIVYHKLMENLYSSTVITREKLDSLISDREGLKKMIEELICEKMKTVGIDGRNLVIADVILRYAVQTLKTDRKRLRDADSFKVIGREKKVYGNIHGLKFKGTVDRIDSFEPGTVRILDYKTGSVSDAEMDLSSDPDRIVRDLFCGSDSARKPEIAFQLYLYDRLVAESGLTGKSKRLCAIYAASRLFIAPPPEVEVPPSFAAAMDEGLDTLLDEMLDPGVPFRKTTASDNCKSCLFKNLCGR